MGDSDDMLVSVTGVGDEVAALGERTRLLEERVHSLEDELVAMRRVGDGAFADLRKADSRMMTLYCVLAVVLFVHAFLEVVM